MADTGARTLRLLGLLQHHRFWPGDQLADELHVSPRTLRRDIDRLRELGYRVQSTPGVDGGYQLEPGTELPPLLLDHDEAIALAIGLHSVVHGPVTDVVDASVRAMSKLMQILPASVRREVDAVGSMIIASPRSYAGGDVPSVVLATVAQACRDQVRLRFSYVAGNGAETDRTVEPYRIVSVGRRFYLVSFDMMRQDWRTFRLDRMREPDPAKNSFDPRPLPADDLAAYIREQISYSSNERHVEVRVMAPAAAIRPQVGPWATIEPIDERSCRMTMTSDSLDWPAFALATLDAPFEVVDPPELVDVLQAWSARIAASTT